MVSSAAAVLQSIAHHKRLQAAAVGGLFLIAGIFFHSTEMIINLNNTKRAELGTKEQKMKLLLLLSYHSNR